MDTQHDEPSWRIAGIAFAWLMPLTIGLAAALVFLPILDHDFVNWDDHFNFHNNLNYRGLGGSHIRWMWTNMDMGHYQPLSWMLHGLNFRLWGLDPRGYHLTSLFLHVVNGALAVLVFRELLRVATRTRGWMAWCAAGFGGGFFALHPLRAEPVAWATAQRDLLATFFLLLAAAAYLRACLHEREGRRNKGWTLAWNGAFACSLLSKATGVGFPLALLVMDVYPLRRAPHDTPRQWIGPRGRRLLREKTPALAMTVAACALAPLAEHQAGALAPLESAPVADRAILVLTGPAFYVAKTLAPSRLLPLYQRPQEIALLDPGFLPYVLGTIALTLVAIALWKRRPYLLSAWLVFLLLLAPTSGVFQIGSFMGADRYTYASTLSIAALAAGALHLALSRRGRRPAVRTAFIAGSAAWLVILGVLASRQSRIWENSETLWLHVVRQDPLSSVAHLNLGTHYAMKERYEEAIPCFERSLELVPGSVSALTNLAGALSRAGRMDEARERYAELLQTHPDHADALSNLASLLITENHVEEAIVFLRRAVEIEPRHADAQANLGLALRLQGDLAGALEQFAMAVELRPDIVQFRRQLIMGLREMDRHEEADALEAQLNEALLRRRP